MGKRGPAPIKIDWDEFDKLVSFQCTQEEVAAFFDVSVDTLDRAAIRERGEKLAELWTKKRAIGRIRLRKAQLAIVDNMGPGAATLAIYLDKKAFPLERVDQIGAAPTPIPTPDSALTVETSRKSFEDFCEAAAYPRPFPKQVEMYQFGILGSAPRLLLGARGYGKTDYLTIMGVGHDLYLNPEKTWLIITKSKIRNQAIVEEIAKALEANGVVLEKQNSNCIRIAGHQGKDHSVEAITIKTSFRGRHPKAILMDDPVTEEDVSEAMRLLVQRKYNEAFKLCSNVLIVGQPAHAHDLYANLRPLLEKLEVAHGSIPELDHDLEAQRLAGVDEKSIQASYFLKIVSDGSAPFEKINYLDKFGAGDSVAFLDPSHKGKDCSALSIVRQHFQGVAVVGFAEHKAWNHWLDAIVPKLIQFGVKKLAVECNGLGDQPVTMLRQLLAGKGIGVVGVDSSDNKHARIMAAGAFAHLIHLSKESDKLYTNQVIQYEYGAKHDDAPDSLATCLKWIGLIRGKV